MTTKSSDPNKFITLRKKIAALHKDIAFMKNCLQHHLTPTSHKIITKTSTPSHIIKKMESELIKSSISHLYSKLNSITLEAYSLHLKLAREFPEGFPLFLTKVKVAEECESERKRKLHAKKFRQLQTRSNTSSRVSKPMVHPIGNFVVNRSEQQFSSKQLTFLNNGLNFAITPKPDIEQVIIDIETGIKNSDLSIPQANTIRNLASEVIGSRTPSGTQHSTQDTRTIKELKDKPVYYLKADKGNALVVLDKEGYDNAMLEKLNSGPYRRQRTNPLPDMVKRVEKTVKECAPILGEAVKKLKVADPSLPRIRGLPKIHKPGNEMREIVSAEKAPTQRIAKWLVREFQSMPHQFISHSIKNTEEFVKGLKSAGSITEEEIMVSFDVAALFPSIPVREALNLCEDWLLRQRTCSIWKGKVRSYMKLARLCMEENYFTFRGEFYKQTKGAPMGNPLSPFLSELFMANFEDTLRMRGLLPERWWRYVDDVFCIMKKEDLPSLLQALNSTHPNITFTHEQEVEGKLPFLDVLIIREPIGISLEIYRKPTHTQRVIPSTSHHSHQHKMSSFSHMIHRLLTLPLSEIGKAKELEYILEVASLNGYSRETIQNLVNKKSRDIHKKSLTTLSSQTRDYIRIPVVYHKDVTRPLKQLLKRTGIDLVFSSRVNQLKTILGTTKDPIEDKEKSGVYQISCTQCDKMYIGQTKRPVSVRFKEHIAETTKAVKQTEKGLHHHFKSKVAEHIVELGHTMENAKVIKRVGNPRKLDVAESLEIFKRPASSLLNKDQGNGYSWLFKLLNK